MDGQGDAADLRYHMNVALIADKYNVMPLWTIANFKFRSLLGPETDEKELAMAVRVAYEHATATKDIQQAVAEHIVRDKLEISDDLEAIMLEHPDIAVRVARRSRSTVAVRAPATHPVPAAVAGRHWQCTCPYRFPAVTGAPGSFFACSHCGVSRTLFDWDTFHMSSD
jgi:hypothetical protein